MALTVAFIGVLPLLWLITRADAANLDPAPEPVAVADPAPRSIDSPVPQPVVDAAGLSPSIVKVLEAGGFARATGRTELETQLAPAVLEVLIADGVVLTVPDDAAAAGGAEGVN